MKSTLILLAAGVSALALASAAQAADLIVDTAPAPMVGVVDASGSWDGAYVGVFGGYGWADLDFVGGAPPDEPEPAGWLLGVNAGVNFTLGNGIVAGVVGDLAWADITDSVALPGPSTIESTIDWQGSVRGRLGFDGGSFMPYLTAGLAFAHNTIDATFPVPPGSASDDQTHIGWTVGAGVEFAVSDNVSIDALYRYNDYGEQTYGAALGGGGDLGITSHQVTVGVNFGF